ncbi:uncharacterized protein BDV17DRAFT_293396 [Aspergillus undulatus]|uniref:uncharacterized protein n=1 Tax=Aspergillus undulatus TaxID=1810928 RepID=UPI003CCDCFB6
MNGNPSQIHSAHHALFRAQLSDSLAREEQESFIEWLRNPPPSVTMGLEGIWPTVSQCILLNGAWKTWSREANMKGYLLVAEPTGPRTDGDKQLLLGPECFSPRIDRVRVSQMSPLKVDKDYLRILGFPTTFL